MGKSAIIKNIHKAAQMYKDTFLGKTFLVVYDGDKSIEVLFRKSSFLHLTGVATKLSAENFFDHAIKKNGLKVNEIFFTPDHPYDLAEKKTNHINEIDRLLIQDTFIVTDITTAKAVFKLGITELELLICFGDDTDKSGNVIKGRVVPYSLRIEDIDNGKYQELFEVDYVFSKKTGTKLFDEVLHGDKDKIGDLPETIREKLIIS